MSNKNNQARPAATPEPEEELFTEEELACMRELLECMEAGEVAQAKLVEDINTELCKLQEYILDDELEKILEFVRSLRLGREERARASCEAAAAALFERAVERVYDYIDAVENYGHVRAWPLWVAIA